MGRHIKGLGVLVIILAIYVGVLAIGEIKKVGIIGKDLAPQATISVSGEGERFMKPDLATISFTVRKEAKTVSAAQEEATKQVDAVLAELKVLGIDEKDIKTTAYNIYPKYEWNASLYPCVDYRCPPGKQVLTGYEVSHSSDVKIRKIENAGVVLGKLGELQVTEVGQVAFSIENEDKVKAEARAEAIKEAKEKADKLAGDLGVSLVRIVSFSESGGGYMPMYSKAIDSFGVGGTSVAPTPEIPIGENKIASNVTIVYEIR